MKTRVVKIFLYFLIFLIPSVFLWININQHYNRFISLSAFSITARYYDLTIESIEEKEGYIIFKIKNALPMQDLYGKGRDFEMEISLDMEAVTFNIPMTVSILLAILLASNLGWKKRWEIFYTGLLLLFLLHMASMLLYSLCAIKEIAQNSGPYVAYYINRHLTAPHILCVLKDFLINYAARFEPFLIALYAWVEIKKRAHQIPS